MRSHRRGCAIFSASFSTLFGLAAASTHAQFAPTASLNDGVRSAEMQMPQLQMPSSTGSEPMIQPPAVAPAFSDNGPVSAAPILPAAFNQFSSPGGPMQATEVQHPQAQLRDTPGSTNAVHPNAVYGQQPGYRNTAMQQPAYPPVFPNQPAQFQQQPFQQQQFQQSLPAAQLRNQSGGSVLPPQTGGINAVPVVSGDPRFVSQPPAQRPGNFPTSPYRGPYRTVGYQLPQQSPPQLPVQAPSALANQPQVVPPTSPLPQYQPTVGQLASYQTLQPGYNCAPGIPSNGVPAYVPGAVVPPTLPPNLTPQLYTPDNAGYRPLFSLGQENYNVQLGRGIIGQPTVYVTGQPVRNFLRYLSP